MTFSGSPIRNWYDVPRLYGFWQKRRRTVLVCAVTIMSIVAFVWLGYEFWRFFREPARLFGREIVPGGVDLKLLYKNVRNWFAGIPVYSVSRTAVYPPASHVIAWPLVGWPGYRVSRLLWTAATLLSLAFLIRLCIRESGASTPLERAFAGLMPLAAYPAGAVIGNGQLTILVIATLTLSLLLLVRGEEGWETDSIASSLFLVALAKPHVSAPFFWIAIFIPGRARPVLLIIAGYCALTLFAASWQDAGLLSLMASWLSHSTGEVAKAGYANLQFIFASLGLKDFGPFASLFILSALGVIIHLCRRADSWLLIGITAITARFWTYHQWYDDLLILLPMISLFRVAKSISSSESISLTAGTLLGACMLMMLAPGGHFLLPPPWISVYMTVLVSIWLIIFAFLVRLAWKDRKGLLSSL